LLDFAEDASRFDPERRRIHVTGKEFNLPSPFFFRYHLDNQRESFNDVPNRSWCDRRCRKTSRPAEVIAFLSRSISV
jgi:hypothetical protein